MIKLVIADDHQIVRAGIRALLLGRMDVMVVDEAPCARDVLAVIKRSDADVLLLDLVFPDGSGIDLIRPVCEVAPDMRILVLSAEMDEEVICEAVSRGAIGFLHKDASTEELIKAIHSAYNGEPYFGQRISAIIYKSYAKRLQDHPADLAPELSHREKQIIGLLAEGFSLKEVADRLFISPRTVENHKSNILQKLGLRNTVELLRYAIKNKIVTI